ncbi:MAG: HTH domain-containing protein [Bacteroidaceae bacterium]|nr:HTH domain-containing protein [Bacteroidaceae bacterium]
MQHTKERSLRLLILLMQRTRRFSVPQLADELEVDRRTVYRYIDTLNDAGFVVHTDHHQVRLEMNTSINKQLSDLLYFNHAEATTLFHAIDSIETDTAFRAELKRKLHALYSTRTVADKVMRLEHDRVRARLMKAMEQRRQTLFKGYSSPNSNTSRDRLVEAFQLSEDGNYVWAFEVETKQNKVFRISRIQAVEEQEQCWLHSRLHQAGYTDDFRIISFDGKTIPVRMRLQRRAYNLLVEEFPDTEQNITHDPATEEWIYEARVSNMKGIGRFVLGLADSIRVESPELRSYIRYFAQRYILELPYGE